VVTLTKLESGKYAHSAGYTVTRRKWHTPVACITWRVETPDGKHEDCDTLADARQYIADCEEDREEQAALTQRVLADSSMRRVHRFFR
jgi:hypothetical protein